MRLLPRLILAVSVPLVILSVAVALVFVSLTRVTSALAQLRVRELTSMQDEAGLHRAGWALDVAMRHAAESCSNDPSAGPRVVSSVQGAARHLDQSVRGAPDAHDRLLRVSRDYLALSRQVVQGSGCRVATSPQFQRRRSLLDEELTNVWVARMQGLHRDVIVREEEMRGLTSATLFGGLLLSGLAVALALIVSLALARSITAPLASLTEIARRLGEGDFAVQVPDVSGPAELVEFGGELEIMRGRLAELDSLKQGFIASCSHELRTPLSKMREALALLADGAVGELDDRQLRVVGIARAACERQIRTVGSILDLSRLRAGTPLRIRAGVSPDEVIRDAIEQELPEADARGVRVEAEWIGAGVSGADLDDALLEHAVANLIRNAVSVSAAGQEVRVVRRVESRHKRAGAAAWLVVDVVDQGPGVPDEMVRAIFRPFVTHASSESPKRVGVGLGLALAREVVEAHGGELELLRPQRGSVFRLAIPLHRDAPEVAA